MGRSSGNLRAITRRSQVVHGEEIVGSEIDAPFAGASEELCLMTRRDDAVRAPLLTGVRPAVHASLVHAANLCDNGVPAALLNQGCDGAGHCDKLRQSQLNVNPLVSKIADDPVRSLRDQRGMQPLPFQPEWFEQNFKRTGTKAADLVRYLQSKNINIDHPKMSKSLAGNRNFTDKEKFLTLVFFGEDPDEVLRGIYSTNYDEYLSEASTPRDNISKAPANIREPERHFLVHTHGKIAAPNAGLPERLEYSSATMPILGASIGGDSRTRTLFNGQRLGDVTRPASLANNPRAYATYVHGESMEPRYEAGEIVLVNPDKGYRKGNYVVAQVHEDDSDLPFGYVKRFVSFGDDLVLEQLNPPEGEDRIMRFPRDRVVSVHRIVGTLDE
jgi:hypothetical protein